MPGIGIDEWVARSAERHDQGRGWRRRLAQAEARMGWWQRLGLVALAGVIAGQLLTNVNVQTVAFNSLLYALLALGLNIAVGWAGLLDLGYIAFFGCGAYGYALLSSTATGSGGSGGTHLAAIVSIPIVLVATGGIGVVIGLIALRLSGDYLAIVTLFVGQAFMEFVNNVDPGTLGGVNGLYSLDPLHSLGGRVESPLGYYYVALIMVVALAGILHLLDTSRTGRAWRALRDDPLAASAMTIPVNNVDPGTLGGVNGLYSLDPLHSLGGRVESPLGYYYVALIMVVALAGILHLLDTSRTGRAWRALRDDPLAASAMTIPVNKLKVMAFSFGAVVGALAGTIFAAQQDTVFPTNFTANILILIYACLVLGGVGSIAGAILGGLVVTIGEQMLSSPNDAGYLFYGLILIALVVRIRPWRRLGAVVAGVAALGFAAHAVVGAISSAAVAGSPGSGGWIGSALGDYVIVPGNPATYGNILYVVLICALVLIVRLHGTQRLIAIVPTVYIAACCWESRLIVNPAITTQIMIGAILIVTMAARPQGLLGTRRVETVLE